jgi:hypothetical protein
LGDFENESVRREKERERESESGDEQLSNTHTYTNTQTINNNHNNDWLKPFSSGTQLKAPSGLPDHAKPIQLFIRRSFRVPPQLLLTAHAATVFERYLLLTVASLSLSLSFNLSLSLPPRA